MLEQHIVMSSTTGRRRQQITYTLIKVAQPLALRVRPVDVTGGVVSGYRGFSYNDSARRAILRKLRVAHQASFAGNSWICAVYGNCVNVGAQLQDRVIGALKLYVYTGADRLVLHTVQCRA